MKCKNRINISFLMLLVFLVSILAACSNSDLDADPITTERPEPEPIITVTEPHIPIINVPRVRILEHTVSSPKVYIPLEIEGDSLYVDGLLQQLNKEDLPVITHYGLEDHEFGFDVIFNKTPESVSFIIYNEDLKDIKELEYLEYLKELEALEALEDNEEHEELDEPEALDAFTIPSEIGDYIKRIGVSWLEDNGVLFNAEYFIRIVVGEPREPCEYIDWYHGGGKGLIFHDNFQGLLQLYYALLEPDDRTLEDFLSTLCKAEYGMQCPCFLQTRVDVQNLFSWVRLDELRLPVSESIPLHTMLVRERYGDIYVVYELNGMNFNFFVSLPNYTTTAEESIQDWETQGVEPYYRLTTLGDLNIYVSESSDDPRAIFVLSVNGAYVELSVTIPCANPDSCDRGWDFGSGHSCYGEQVNLQAAIDGLMQFRFITLI